MHCFARFDVHLMRQTAWWFIADDRGGWDSDRVINRTFLHHETMCRERNAIVSVRI